MGRVWVLDTETKGTGANMVPLDRVTSKPGSEPTPVRVLPDRRPPEPKPPEPRKPWEFKVVDVMTRQVLAEGVDVRATVKLLEGIRSIVDVTIWVWQPEAERWRMLTLEEARSLWEYRGRADDRAAGGVADTDPRGSGRVPSGDASEPEIPPAVAGVADHGRGV